LSKIKRLAGETVLYGLGSIVPRFINFFLILPQTSAFNPEEYSVIVDLYAWVAFLNVLYSFGMETAYFRFATKEGANPKVIFNTAQTAVTLVTLVLSTFFIIFSQPISSGLYIPGHADYIIWLTCVISIDALVAIPFARLRLEKKALTFALARIMNVTVIVILNFYFLKVAYNPQIGVAYVFLINLLANALYLFFFGKTLLQWRPALDKHVFGAMVIYAYPIMLTGLAGMTNEMFSRITLRSWLPQNFYPGKSSSYALGIFGACYKFAMFMSLIIQAFRFAAEPFFFSNASDKNSPSLFATVNHYFVIACCILLLAVGLNLDILKYLLRDPAYWEGLSIVPILLVAYLFLGVYYNLSVWFKLTDKTYYGTIITVGGALLTILMNFILIPIAGYLGSSWAALICYLSMAVACYIIGQRFYPIPYKIRSGIAYIILTIVLIYAMNFLKIANQLIALAIHNLFLFVYLIVVYRLERLGLKRAAVL
jgi:O-antigen/teichoic acid export membrane protein